MSSGHGPILGLLECRRRPGTGEGLDGIALHYADRLEGKGSLLRENDDDVSARRCKRRHGGT